MNKLLKILCVSFIPVLASCGSNSSLSSSNSNKEDITTTEESLATSETTSIDMGTVTINNIVVVKDFDGIKIRPQFSKPEYAISEHFEYTFKDENQEFCYIDEDKVYYLSDTSGTLVLYKSEHFEGRFIVRCRSSFPNAAAIGTAKVLANKVKTGIVEKGSTLFVGASYFEFWRNGNNGVETFTKSFEGYKVENVGIAGTTSVDWRALEKKLAIEAAPKNIVLSIGNNDVNDLNSGVEGTISSIIDLLNDFFEYLPDTKIYYASMHRSTGSHAWNWATESAINSAIEGLTTKYPNLKYIDIAGLIGEDYPNTLLSDGMHPNQKGYDYYKEAILNKVDIDKIS